VKQDTLEKQPVYAVREIQVSVHRGYPMTKKPGNGQPELTDRKSFTALANDQPVNTILHPPGTQE
jgi:hypothetical protein